MFRHLKVGDSIARNMAGIVKSGKVLFVEEDILYWKDNDFPLEEKEELEYLAKALDMLNEKDKTVLSLYYYDGLTLKEIGKVLNVSESRVCQLHSRAIVHLRKSMMKLKYIN